MCYTTGFALPLSSTNRFTFLACASASATLVWSVRVDGTFLGLRALRRSDVPPRFVAVLDLARLDLPPEFSAVADAVLPGLGVLAPRLREGSRRLAGPER